MRQVEWELRRVGNTKRYSRLRMHSDGRKSWGTWRGTRCTPLSRQHGMSCLHERAMDVIFYARFTGVIWIPNIPFYVCQ